VQVVLQGHPAGADFCLAAKEIGLESIELLDPKDFATVKKHGLHCAMVSYPTIEGPDGVKIGPIPKGFNRMEHHDLLVQAYEPLLKERRGRFQAGDLLQRQSRRHERRAGPRKLRQRPPAPAAAGEKLGVTLVMELLNSKVNHPDYMCDHSAWGVALCKKLGSPHFQAALRHLPHADHGGRCHRHHQKTITNPSPTTTPAASPDVPRSTKRRSCITPPSSRPSRKPVTPAISGQEFIPKRPDKLASLKQGVQICTVG
jgi:hypothetical protein